jgi:hypothetical protein
MKLPRRHFLHLAAALLLLLKRRRSPARLSKAVVLYFVQPFHCLKAVYQFCLGGTAPARRVHCNMRANYI